MKIEFNSQAPFYKKPFGAVSEGSETEFQILLNGVGIPWSVKLVILPDEGEETYFDMHYVFSVMDSSVYSVKIKADTVGLFWYFFEIRCEEGTFFYGNNKEGLGGIGEIYKEKPTSFYQLTIFERDYKTPNWFKSGVAYQIFPDRFFNGTEDKRFLGERDDIIKRNWGDTPFYKSEQFGGEYLSNDFFGGNLQGVEKKLPYLKELGISIIYLNPIFKAFSNHKYDTGDYLQIDPMFGTEEDFIRLSKKAAESGIHIILDGVFNHTGSNSRYFNKNGEYDDVGAYQSKNSPYFDWYSFKKYPEEYDCWWGMKTLPHTNEESESFRKFILSDENSVVKKWLRLGSDGWRLDVVDELPDFFVKELRRAVKEEKSDAIIIGEVWEDASNKSSYGQRREYFLGRELDSAMNYPLRAALTDGVLGRISAETMNRRIMSLKENYPREAFYSSLNMLSGHDIERILTVMGEAPSRDETTRDFQAGFTLTDKYELAVKRLIQITGLQMTLPGVPCIFYGDETGMQGYADPFCRACMDFSCANDENIIFREFKKLIKLRNTSSALCEGEFTPVYTIGNVFGFVRESETEKLFILSNMGDRSERIRVDLARFGAFYVKNLYDDEKMKSDLGIYFIDILPHENKFFKLG